jgi:lipopolysaccharide/colanic/teichoic acid biosynthesis glycosyltransferase
VVKILLFLIVDVLAFNVAFLSAYYLRVILSDIFTNPIYPIGAYSKFVSFQNLLFVFTYFAAGLYKIRRETTAVDELFNIIKAIVLASILLMTSTYISHIRTYSRMVVAFLVPFAILCDWFLRMLIRKLHRGLLAQKIDLKRVCIVGAPSQARQLELKLSNDPALGVEVVGIVATEQLQPGGQGRSLGEISELGSIVEEYRVQELIFLPNAVPEERIAEFVTMGRRRVLDVTVLTDYSGLVIHQATVANLAGRPVIAYGRDTRYVLDRVVKRLLDITLGVLFLVLSLPFHVLYYLYATMRGEKSFSREERLGLGGKSFILPLAGARSSNGPSDIVNSPLFWLVVSGKMSMVGPYPLAPSEAALVDETARFRFDVRPGVTGYWRVGTGNALPLEDLLAQDANYTRNWSLVQDLKILSMSFGNILLGRKRSLTIERPDGAQHG